MDRILKLQILALVCCACVSMATAAYLPSAEQDDEQLLNKLRAFSEEDAAGLEPNIAEKRYSEGQFMSLNSARQDRAAFRKLLRLLVGKRSVESMLHQSAMKRSGVQGPDLDDLDELRAWVILAGKLNGQLINEALTPEELDM